MDGEPGCGGEFAEEEIGGEALDEGEGGEVADVEVVD